MLMYDCISQKWRALNRISVAFRAMLRKALQANSEGIKKARLLDRANRGLGGLLLVWVELVSVPGCECGSWPAPGCKIALITSR